MAYEVMAPKHNGDPISARDWNRIVGNFAAGIPDIMEAKGDLVAGVGPDAAARVPVGANGAYLFADSTSPSGIKWSSSVRLSAYAAPVEGNALASGAWYAVNWITTELIDNSAAYDGMTFIAPVAGYYLVSAKIYPKANYQYAWSGLSLAVFKNGSMYAYLGSYFTQRGPTGAYFPFEVGGSCVIKMIAGNYLRLAYHTTVTPGMWVNRSNKYDWLVIQQLI